MILGFDRAVKQQLDSAQAAKRGVKLCFVLHRQRSGL